MVVPVVDDNFLLDEVKILGEEGLLFFSNLEVSYFLGSFYALSYN